MKFETNQQLKDYTTLHIGGPAALFASPSSLDEMREVLRRSQEENRRLFILGNGSNVLFDDQGFDGIILHIGPEWSGIERLDETHVRVKSGTTNEQLAAWLQKEGLSGYEFACGVPGTIGGAIMMNAGCYGGETRDVLRAVECLDQDGKLQEYDVEELNLGYRHSRFMDEFGIITAGIYELTPGDPDKIQDTMDDLQQKRYAKQPMEKHSCGSTFKRPEGYYAGTLIDQSGLRGYRIGDAMVSEKHCGFLINDGNCTSRQFKELIAHVQKTVKEKFGVDLECEVREIPHK